MLVSQFILYRKSIILWFCLFAVLAYGLPHSTVSESTVSSWRDVAEMYEIFRDETHPLVVPGESWSTYDSWETVQRELTSFVKGSWFWYFPSSELRVDPSSRLSRHIERKANLLVYEDIYTGEIVVAKERKNGTYEEVYSQKTVPILEALTMGMSTYEETSRRRIVWQPSVVPYHYVKSVDTSGLSSSDIPVMRGAAMSVPTLPGGGGTNSGSAGLLGGMTLEQWNAIHSPTNMWLEVELLGTNGAYSYKVVVHTPTNNTHNVDLFCSTQITNPFPWTLIAGGIALDANKCAVWTDAISNAETTYYRSSDAEHDPDSDGLASGRERFIHGTRADMSDTDEDGNNDYDEIMLDRTDPCNPDVDRPVIALLFPAEGQFLEVLP